MFRDPYVRLATVKKIVDGDTIDVNVDCGFRRFSVERLRLSCIDTPEIRSSNPEEKANGFRSKEYVEKALPIGSNVVIRTEKGDVFGRWLAEVYYKDSEGVDRYLNQELLNEGLAVPF